MAALAGRLIHRRRTDGLHQPRAPPRRPSRTRFPRTRQTRRPPRPRLLRTRQSNAGRWQHRIHRYRRDLTTETLFFWGAFSVHSGARISFVEEFDGVADLEVHAVEVGACADLHLTAGIAGRENSGFGVAHVGQLLL